MWILHKDKQCAVNTDHVDCIYVVTTGVRARFASHNKDLTLGEYESGQMARAVLESVYGAMSRGVDYKMPDDEHAKAALSAVNLAGKQRAADGKKTVRRGGS